MAESQNSSSLGVIKYQGNTRRANKLKVSLPLLGLGALAIVVGVIMRVIRYHTTIGYGVAGLGAVLVVVSLFLTLRKRPPASGPPSEPRGSTPKMSSGVRKGLIAIVAIGIIGVGTFYGTSYLAGTQTVAIVSTSSAAIPQETGPIFTATQTESGGSMTCTTSSGLIQGSPPVVNCFSTTTQGSVGLSSSQQITSGSASTTSIPSQTLTTGSASTTATNWFTLTGTPAIVVNGRQAALSAAFVNTLKTNLTIAVFVIVQNATGGVVNQESVSHSNVPGGYGFSLVIGVGTFQPGTYSANFYVQELASGRQVSQTTSLQFTVN